LTRNLIQFSGTSLTVGEEATNLSWVLPPRIRGRLPTGGRSSSCRSLETCDADGFWNALFIRFHFKGLRRKRAPRCRFRTFISLQSNWISLTSWRFLSFDNLQYANEVVNITTELKRYGPW